MSAPQPVVYLPSTADLDRVGRFGCPSCSRLVLVERGALGVWLADHGDGCPGSLRALERDTPIVLSLAQWRVLELLQDWQPRTRGEVVSAVCGTPGGVARTLVALWRRGLINTTQDGWIVTDLGSRLE